MTVCAVAPRPTPGLGVQTVVADRLRQGVARALASGADWIWVLDGSAIPRPGALEALLAGLGRVGGLPEPALLTGVVVTADGRVDPNRPPWYRRFQIDVALASAESALVPVRGGTAPVLVRSDAAAADPPRRGAPIAPGTVLQWSARLLRSRTGYLVPESESDALATRRDPMLEPATAARLLAGRALVKLDRVGVVLELCERVGLR
jgi:hypothetical protein